MSRTWLLFGGLTVHIYIIYICMYMHIIALILENITRVISIARVPDLRVSHMARLMSDLPGIDVIIQ